MVVISGRLVADPEEIMDGKMLKFSVAVDRAGYEKDSDSDAGFFNCKMWLNDTPWNAPAAVDATRELVNNGRLGKGAPVRLIGQINQDRFIDKDGNKRSEVNLVVDHIDSFAKSNASSGSEPASQSTAVAGGAEPF